MEYCHLFVSCTSGEEFHTSRIGLVLQALNLRTFHHRAHSRQRPQTQGRAQCDLLPEGHLQLIKDEAGVDGQVEVHEGGECCIVFSTPLSVLVLEKGDLPPLKVA